MKALSGYLKTQRITQSELARRLGVDRHQVSKWMTGAKAPALETRKKMAKKLGLNITDLL